MTDWQAVTIEALRDPASLMRAFAAMSFRRHIGTVPRGDVLFWPPVYARGPMAKRHHLAALNRSLRDAPVHILMTDAAQFLVCSWAGEWRTHDGAQIGDDLASLGALRWGVSRGQATGRLARVIGLTRIPEIPRGARA